MLQPRRDDGVFQAAAEARQRRAQAVGEEHSPDRRAGACHIDRCALAPRLAGEALDGGGRRRFEDRHGRDVDDVALGWSPMRRARQQRRGRAEENAPEIR